MNRSATKRSSLAVATCAPARQALPACAGNEFTIVGLVHEGRWSKVYRVRPQGSVQGDAPYTMKVPAGEHDPVAAGNMLRREIRVIQSVPHANLVALLDYRLGNDGAYLLTPYLEGATLRAVFDAGLRCPLGHALWIARQMAQALAALHCAGWRHGDVKPANVLISPSGHATLLDLGLAQRLDTEGHSPPDNCIAGSLSYLAPECLQDGERAGPQADIYSLGAVLFQMIAGRPPFVAPNAASLIDAHLQSQPPEVPVTGCAVASDVRHLVSQMLHKQPLRRPASADQLARRLMRLEIATLYRRTKAA